MTRTRWSIVLALGAVIVAATAAALLAWRAPAPTAPESAPLRVSRYYWPGEYWIDIAAHHGWFREAGLQVELVDTNPDYFKSLQDTVDGAIDMNNFTLFDLMLRNSRGADLVMVLRSDDSDGADAIVGRAGLRGVKDLRGKRVAVGVGTYGEYVLEVALEQHGLSGDAVIKVDTPGEHMVAALVAGKVDAIIVWEPFASEAMAKARGRRLFDTAQVRGMMPLGMAVPRRVINQRPQDVQALVRVWHRATRFIKENPQTAYAIIAGIYAKTPAEVEALTKVDRILDLADNLAAYSFTTGFDSSHGAARKINDFLLRHRLSERRLDSLDFLDARFILALQREGA